MNRLKYTYYFFCVLWIFCTNRADGCPVGCACVIGGQVICNYGGLTEVPENLPSTTRHLSLNENHIGELRADAFQELIEIQSIHLDNNNITTIAPYSFRGVKDADEITLQNNPLDHLPSYSFSDMDNVGRVYLSYNRISSIHANAFYGSKNIREISLIGNPLKRIESHAFSGLQHIRFFYFPKGLTTIESDAFNGLANVGMLRLENVTTATIQSYAFRGLTNVSGIEIRSSLVGTIEAEAFGGLKNVDHLGFNHNRIGLIQSNAFEGMHRLINLVFEDNIVDEINQDSLDDIIKAKRLSFTNNQLPCDCQLKYLQKVFLKLEDDEVNYCNFPAEAIGNQTADFNLDEIEICETPAAVLPLEQLQTPNINAANYDRCLNMNFIIIVILVISFQI
ncbi:hypothetical protein CHUAL_005059 [Chamberlinius hualienensis]